MHVLVINVVRNASVHHKLDIRCLTVNTSHYESMFYFSELAFIAPETKRVLERLSHMPDVNVVIISGREMEDLRNKVSITFSNINFCLWSCLYFIVNVKHFIVM